MFKKTNLKWVALAFVIICAFWWTSVKPYLDRKYCNEYAAAQVEGLGSPADDKLFTLYGRHYTVCVNARGLGE